MQPAWLFFQSFSCMLVPASSGYCPSSSLSTPLALASSGSCPLPSSSSSSQSHCASSSCSCRRAWCHINCSSFASTATLERTVKLVFNKLPLLILMFSKEATIRGEHTQEKTEVSLRSWLICNPIWLRFFVLANGKCSKNCLKLLELMLETIHVLL